MYNHMSLPASRDSRSLAVNQGRPAEKRLQHYKGVGHMSGRVLPPVLALSLLLSLSCYAADDTFEVKGVAASSIIFADGKVEKSEHEKDQVTYLVDIPRGIVTRTAVYNEGIKEGVLAGLQSDNSEYTIIHDEPPNLFTNQRLIKAFGKVAAMHDSGDTRLNSGKLVMCPQIREFGNRENPESGNSH